MDNESFDAYLTRAEFFNATGRTNDGYHGQMTRKPILITVPEKLREYLLNVDGKGSSAEKFFSDVAYNSLITSWGGIFIDAPEAVEGMSKQDAIRLGVFPFMSYVCAENLYNWHYGTINRKKILDRVIIKSTKEIPTSDPFTYKEATEFKTLYLDNEGNYCLKNYLDSVAGAENVPKKNGKPLKQIPFFTCPGTEPEKPLTLDLVNLNLAWYRKSADLENGGHWSGVPTPYILGYTPDVNFNEKGEPLPAEPIRLGGASLLCLPSGTQIDYLEYKGAGLGQLRQMMIDDEERMAILGARIISAEKKGVESAETAKIHRTGENSVLASFANNLSAVFTNALRFYLEWISETEINPDEIKVEINTDYEVSKMNVQELTALVSLWQSGGIPHRVLVKNMKEGELIDNNEESEKLLDEVDAEKERKGIIPGLKNEV